MKHILVACGTGMSTSTMIAGKLKNFLSEEGINIETYQCCLNEIPMNLVGKDLIVTSMKIDNEYSVKSFNGSALLTGINAGPLKQEILNYLKS